MSNIVSVVDKISPPQKKVTRPGIRWFDAEVKLVQKQRKEYYKIFKFTEKDFEKYKLKRNLVVGLIGKNEREFYENEIDKNKGESKKMWKTLKELVNKGQKSVDFSLLDLQIQGGAIEDSEFLFADSIKQPVSSIPEPFRVSKKLNVRCNVHWNRFPKFL
ncbi:hypothetical protein HHI36_008794 [Cryptolaemus montrouzieri]|uniref:Uncharacterized protein n=1 Tax=Cryptolaemus montrouzieri TaxID=559131 RepID=A0ABD2MU76_9CUCU